MLGWLSSIASIPNHKKNLHFLPLPPVEMQPPPYAFISLLFCQLHFLRPMLPTRLCVSSVREHTSKPSGFFIGLGSSQVPSSPTRGRSRGRGGNWPTLAQVFPKPFSRGLPSTSALLHFAGRRANARRTTVAIFWWSCTLLGIEDIWDLLHFYWLLASKIRSLVLTFYYAFTMIEYFALIIHSWKIFS